MNSAISRFKQLTGTVFGLGSLPGAPGTWGSLAALLPIYLLGVHTAFGVWALALLCSALTLWAARSCEERWGPDPSNMVIDEWAGQALALAARMRGIPAYVVMPENSPKVKLSAVEGYGAKVIRCESNQKAREETLQKVVNDTGASFIHPYDNKTVIAGQGTCACELLMEYPGLDIIMAPVGGGGLLSGTSITARELMPKMLVIGSEPEQADDASQSLKTGKLQKFDTTNTIADGLRTTLSERTFAIIQQNVDDILTVSDDSIIRAMRTVWERMNIIIEASCSVPVAAILEKKIDITGKKVGVILTGGNVDLEHLPWQE